MGEEWTEGKVAKGTVYDLLPVGLREQLQQNRTMPTRAPGIVRFPGSSNSRPRLSDLDRAVMRYTIDLLRWARREEIGHRERLDEIARFIQISGGPVVKLPRMRGGVNLPVGEQQEEPAARVMSDEELEKLLDWPPEPPVRYVSSGDSAAAHDEGSAAAGRPACFPPLSQIADDDGEPDMMAAGVL